MVLPIIWPQQVTSFIVTSFSWKTDHLWNQGRRNGILVSAHQLIKDLVLLCIIIKESEPFKLVENLLENIWKLVNLVSCVDKCVTIVFGDCAFSTYAPRIWNKLPAYIKSSQFVSFKMLLKTHLFSMFRVQEASEHCLNDFGALQMSFIAWLVDWSAFCSLFFVYLFVFVVVVVFGYNPTYAPCDTDK